MSPQRPCLSLTSHTLSLSLSLVQSGGGHDTLLPSGDGRGTSLPTITTNTNANLTTNDNQTSRYGNRMPLANKENAIPFNDIPRERVSVRQLRFTKQLPSLVAPGDNKFEKYDYEPRVGAN